MSVLLVLPLNLLLQSSAFSLFLYPLGFGTTIQNQRAFNLDNLFGILVYVYYLYVTSSVYVLKLKNTKLCVAHYTRVG